MCYTKTCKYEDHHGECNVPAKAPLPSDSLCVILDGEHLEAKEWDLEDETA